MAKVNLTAEKCPDCNAPLELRAGAVDVKCRYCGTVVHAERPKAEPAVRAIASGPPVPRMAPVHPAPARTVRRTGWLTVIAFGLIGTVALPAFLTALATSTASNRALFGQSRAISAFPASCGMNEDITISGVHYSGTGTLVDAGLNCKVHIRNSTLSGDLVVQGGLNTKVTIENSTLVGKDTAIAMSINGEVRITSQSQITASGITVSGEANLTLIVDDSKVTGTDSAIRSRSNGNVTLTRAHVSSSGKTIDLDTGGKISLKDSTVQSTRTAISGDTNLDVIAQGSTIDGATRGIHGGTNLSVDLTKKSRVTSASTGIEGGINLDVTADDSTIHGATHGIVAALNASVKLGQGARLESGGTALTAESNLKLEVEGSTIEATRTAVQGESNAQVTAATGVIRGGSYAFFFSRAPSVFEVGDAVTHGNRVFDGHEKAGLPRK